MLNNQEKYTLRKSKKYKNLVSVGLGLATAVAIGVATDNEAFASEEKAETPVINEVTSQENVTSSVEVNVKSEELNKAVEKAQNDGIKVEKSEVDKGTVKSQEELEKIQKEIQEDYKKQEQEIKEKTENYVKEKEEHKNAETTITNENTAKKQQYEKYLASYNKEKTEKEELNKNITKENEEKEERNTAKKSEYESKLKELEEKKKQNEQYESNEFELIVKSGGFRVEKDSKVEFKQGERINVEANGNIEVTSTNFYSVTNNWSLDIKLSNSSLKDGGIVDLTFERLNGVLLDNSELKIDGETVGLVKLVEVVKKESQPKTVNDSVEGYNLMHTGKYRLIFNENILKYKNRHITLSGKNVPVYPYYYGKNKDVTQNIYVNDKLVASSSTVIPSQPVEPVIKNVSADINKIGVNIKNDGQISPSNIKYVIYNSTPNQLNRGTRIEVGDIITFKLENNSPIKYNPDSIKERLNSLFWTPARNEGKNMNLAGTVVNQDIVPKYELLKATETEVSFVIKEVPKDSAFHLNVELGFGSAKITSFNKADYLSSKTYRQELNIKSANGVEKYKTVINQSIGISGANIDAVGDLKPQNPIDVYKIKINYVDELGNSLKDTYKENNLYYGDKYTVNVPKIKGYNFIQEKDSKILNGVLREDKEYTLVYKKLNDIVNITPPAYETPKPLVELPQKPTEPEYKEIPKAPEAPTLKYTVYKINVIPTPQKHNFNKDGVNIDGKEVLPNSTQNYKLIWDLDQYKDIEVDNDTIAKGFFFVDDYPEDALKLNTDKITLEDSKGDKVEGVEVVSYESLEQAPKEVQEMLQGANITPKGAFQLFKATNPQEFFEKYVKTGNSITITTPMTVKEELKKSGGKFENKAYQIDFGIGYETDVVVNNVVKVEPQKHNYNEVGVNIDGKEVLVNSIQNYKLIWDLDQYKDIEVSKEVIAKGFFFVDDYPEDALKLNTDKITLEDSKGDKVEGVEVVSYESLEQAPKEVQEMLQGANITPKGAFQLFKATNPQEFFEKYVKTGNSITITTPMTVKEELKKSGGKFENKAYQIDFGIGYETDIVVNNVPKIEPKKDVVIDVKNGESLDGKEIEMNTIFNYHLIGSKLPANRGTELKQYGFSDDYDEKGDKYQGNYKVFAMVNIKLKDGTVITKNTDLTKYTTQQLTDGKVNIEFDKKFLNNIDLDSEFQADIYLEIERIGSGTIENTYIHLVNGVEVSSNTVKTTTPKSQEQPKTPEQQKMLPKTGLADNTATTGLALGMLGVVSTIARRKNKKETE